MRRVRDATLLVALGGALALAACAAVLGIKDTTDEQASLEASTLDVSTSPPVDTSSVLASSEACSSVVSLMPKTAAHAASANAPPSATSSVASLTRRMIDDPSSPRYGS